MHTVCSVVLLRTDQQRDRTEDSPLPKLCISASSSVLVDLPYVAGSAVHVYSAL
jgi:hypothetical protein